MQRFCGLCPNPTRNAAYVCDRCGDLWAADLRDVVDWLDEELETAMTGQQGNRARPTSGGSGEDGLRVNWHASNARERLERALRQTVTHCLDYRVRHTSPREDRPARQPRAMADWLLWRVDGLCLDPEGPRLAGLVADAVFAARRAVDCPPDRQWLGSCLECGRGRLYVREGEPLAVCDVCRTAYEALEVRVWLLDQLDDKLLSAAEIARVSTYLGLRSGREVVRKRLNTWHVRGTIQAEPSMTDEVVFRFGPIWRMLLAHDSARSGA